MFKKVVPFMCKYVRTKCLTFVVGYKRSGAHLIALFRQNCADFTTVKLSQSACKYSPLEKWQGQVMSLCLTLKAFGLKMNMRQHFFITFIPRLNSLQVLARSTPVLDRFKLEQRKN